MLKFLQFLKEQKKEKGTFFINSQGYAVLSPGPGIGSHKKNKKNLKEDTEQHKLPSLDSLPGQYQKDPKDDFIQHEKKRIAFHDKTGKELSKIQHQPTPEEKQHIKAFTDYSGDLNEKLIKNHKENKPEHHGLTQSDKPRVKYDTHEKSIHEHIKRLASKPIGKELHVYSGTGFDPSKAAKESKDGILHSPAHMSTSHDVDVADEFASQHTQKDENGKKTRHIMHVHLKPTDKAFHIGKKATADFRYQNETVLPAGTKLKYSHTTHHDSGYNDPNFPHISVHHFTIHHQE